MDDRLEMKRVCWRLLFRLGFAVPAHYILTDFKKDA